MSSLGYQVVYQRFNAHPDIQCERAVLPTNIQKFRQTGRPLTTIETGQTVGGADCIAISLAFEPDIFNVLELLSLARIPALRTERGTDYAPVVLGGPITMSNALPLAPFADAIVLGDAEVVVEALSEALLREKDHQNRHELLEELSTLPGVFVPEFHGTAVPDLNVSPTDDLPAVGGIWTPDSELSGMRLIEVARGCPRYCSFCVMRAAAQPMREAPLEKVAEALNTDAPRIGFVGAAVSEYSHIRETLKLAISAGKGVGISSLRADRLDEEFVGLLHEGGYRTMTIASDAPSQTLRARLKKGLRDRHLIRAAELAAQFKMKVLKMYVIVGLPNETLDDIDELANFSLTLQSIIPRVALGIAPFVPKLHTPLGDAPFEDVKVLERRLKHLRNRLKGRVEMRSVSARWAWVEYRLSQGGVEAGYAAYEAWKNGGSMANYRRAFAAADQRESQRAALITAQEHGLWDPAGMR
jgi:radical SAM superfamily enzyme YgiQ (UPF0313 family)